MTGHNPAAIACSVTLAALAAASASAQTAPAPATAVPAEGSPAAAEAPTGIQDIIVTAQRRGENLQRVPISVSAVTADMARTMGINGSQDLPIAAPALTFSETSSGANITIRGVGASGSAVDEAGNAVYIDGVYQAAAPALVFALNNIERVEVLKGPQGTLFGRNATGGLIQIITRTPQDHLAGDFSLSYSNYRTIEAQAYLTGPIANGLAADVAVYEQHQGEGWGTNLYNGKDTYKGRAFAIRGKLRWDLDDRTNATLVGSRSSVTPAGGQGGGILPGEVSRSAGGVSGAGYAGFYNTNQNGTSSNRATQNATALTVNHDFDWGRLLNITAYTFTRLHYLQDADIGPANISQLDIRFPVKTFSQELQLQTPSSSKIKGSVGAYIFANKVAHDPFTLTGLQLGSASAFQRIEAYAKTHSYAVYGQATYPILDGTNLTAGLRYTIDRRSSAGTITTLAGVTPYRADGVTEKKLTWRLSLDQRLGERVTGYVSYNRGFKGGLYNISTPTQPVVGPETVDAYEIGLKSQFLGNRVRLNVAAFYYDFRGIQTRATNNLGVALLLNAASARQKGVDVDLTVSPVRNFEISGGFSYLHSRYRRFDRAPFFAVNPVGGLIQTTVSASGYQTTYSPPWAGTLAANYRIRSGAGDVVLAATVSYNGGYYYDPQNRVSSGSYTLVNPSISWTPRNGSLEVRLWARNLAGEHYLANASTGGVGDQYYPGAPRTYGATLRYKFD